jgi:N-acetylglucosamine kinase-like BadF-type ATPase
MFALAESDYCQLGIGQRSRCSMALGRRQKGKQELSLFLALDAGGTKTDYVLADETTIFARVRSGTIKRLRTDASTALANLEGAFAELAQRTGLDLTEVTRCCVGTAGESVPLALDWLRAEISTRVGGELVILGDVEIALDAAFRGEPGVLVLSGTGSNVAGRGPNGVISTTGGWGPLLADQASGHRIGHEALRAIFLARDEGRESTLLEEAMKFWKLERLEQLIEYANQTPPPDLSRLAPLVVSCAEAGDALADDVLRSQGRELGYLVRLLIRRLRTISGDMSFTPDIAFAGSIAERVATVRDALLADVRVEFPSVLTRKGSVDPVEGALWRARQSRH